MDPALSAVLQTSSGILNPGMVPMDNSRPVFAGVSSVKGCADVLRTQMKIVLSMFEGSWPHNSKRKEDKRRHDSGLEDFA